MTNKLYVLMEYINEVSLRVRKFFTIEAKNFYVLMEYIDEVSLRVRRLFTVEANDTSSMYSIKTYKLFITIVKNLLTLNDTSSMYSINCEERRIIFEFSIVKNLLTLNDTSSMYSIKTYKIFVTIVKNLLTLNDNSLYSIKPRATLCHTCVYVSYLYEQ